MMINAEAPVTAVQAGDTLTLGLEGGTASNQNLLINWYCLDPIDQRGLGEYSGNVYGIDMWKGSAAAHVKSDPDGITVDRMPESTSAYANNINQCIEDYGSLAGKQVTFSALVSRASGAPGFIIWATIDGTEKNIGNASGEYSGKPFLITRTITIPEQISSLRVSLRTAGATFAATFAAAKLELGDRQTLAHQDASGNWVLNDPPPNKALELAKCQRYQIFGPMNGYKVYSYATGKIGVFFPTPVSLRGKPTLVGTLKFSPNGNNSLVDYEASTSMAARGNGVYMYLNQFPTEYADTDMFILEAGSGFDANL